MTEIDHTCLIGINQNRRHHRLDHFGSGVLLKLDRFHVLLSAAHVLFADNLWLPGKPAMPLAEAAHKMYGTSRTLQEAKHDPADIAFIRLAPAAVDALTAIGRSFLPSTELQVIPPERGQFLTTFFAIPYGPTKPSLGPNGMSVTPYEIEGFMLTTAELLALGRDPKLHTGIRYLRKRLQDAHTGKLVKGPKPQGMSGCPIWLTLPDGHRRVYAIGTEYDAKKHVLIGTKLFSVWHPIIEQLFGPGGVVSVSPTPTG